MDYRLVKQNYNNSVDNFFNFFYKTADFFTLMIDVFWAFYDIWYNFVMIFVNMFAFLYYLFLYMIDAATMSRSSVFFWRKSYSYSGHRRMSSVYQKTLFNPVSKMYGSAPVRSAENAVSSAAKSASKATKAVSKTASAATAAAAAAASSVSTTIGHRPYGARKNFFKLFFEGIANFFIKTWEKITKIGEWFKKTVLSKLSPVREDQPQGRKSLVDDYIKEYERKKKRA